MKLTLKDFGPIDEFTLDLSKDIQFIYGENSVGKSYAVFVLYALVKALKNSITDKDRIEMLTSDDYYEIRNKVKEENKRYDVSRKIAGTIASILYNCGFYREFPDDLKTKFSNLSEFSNKKSGNDFQIILAFEKLTIVIENFEKANHIELSVKLNHKIELEYDDAEKGFPYYYEDGVPYQRTLNEKEYLEWDLDFFVSTAFLNPIKKHLKTPYLIPAQRAGVYFSMSSFGPIIAELSKNRAYLQKNKSIELPTLSSDVADYFIHISKMNSNYRSDDLIPFVEQLEKNILKGKIGFDDQRKKIIYYPENSNLALDLTQTSSMIAEVSIIAAFFKYGIRRYNESNERIGNLVIIEEPEAHLHPKTQVALMEIFAELPKYGIKLIVTSHSDFMFDKLGNMIIEGKIDHNTVGTYHMKMGEKGSYDAGDMKATKDGIQDHNFVEISEKLYEERMEIYDQLNEKNAATDYNKE